MEQAPSDVERRAVLRLGLCGAAAAVAVASGCSASSHASTTAATAATSAPGSTTSPARSGGSTTAATVPPSRQRFATADQLKAGALIYHAPDGDNHLGTFTPTPDGQRPTLVGLGDSVLACAYGLGTKSVDPATGSAPGPRTGLARWHDGMDPRFHDALRPSTSETARFGFTDADSMNAWLPAARQLVRGLPVDGVLVQASHALYGTSAASSAAAAALHLGELRAFVDDAVAKAAERGRWSLTIFFPTLVLNPGSRDAYARSIDASQRVLEQLRGLRPEGVADGVRFHVDTSWWDIVRPRLEAQDGPGLLALHDPGDAHSVYLEHPSNDQEGGIRYGDAVVAAYEAMGTFARTGR